MFVLVVTLVHVTPLFPFALNPGRYTLKQIRRAAACSHEIVRVNQYILSVTCSARILHGTVFNFPKMLSARQTPGETPRGSNAFSNWKRGTPHTVSNY